jgi:hypothetical protein
MLVLLAAYSGFAQQGTALGMQLRVRWDGLNIVVIKDQLRHTYDVSKQISAYALTSVKLLSAKTSGDFTYLLFDVKAQSRGPEAAMTYCGAGEERSLIWMKLDKDWNRMDSNNFVIESCFDTAELEDGPDFSFNSSNLLVAGTTTRDPRKEDTIANRAWFHYEVRYSLQHPESGLQITLTPTKMP